MQCEEFRSLVLDSFNGMVKGERLTAFDEHRASCTRGCGPNFEEVRERFKSGMACIDFVELVTAYFDDALTTAERASFDDHLAICYGCQDYVHQMRKTVELTGKLGVEDLPPPELRAALFVAFHAWKTGRRAGTRT